MPAARPASISAQAQVTCPILVAGWVEGSERKWTRSDLDFLRRGCGVDSIDFACITPSPNKETAGGERDAQISLLAMCNNLQTGCEQSASVLGSRQGVHQFVNKVHQIVTVATLQDRSQATKNA
jgi:hypothetical protein